MVEGTHLCVGEVHGQRQAGQQGMVVQRCVAETGAQARSEAPHVLFPAPPEARRCRRRAQAADAVK